MPRTLAPGLLLCLVACAPRPHSLPVGPVAEADPPGNVASVPPPSGTSTTAAVPASSPPVVGAPSASSAVAGTPREPPTPPEQAAPVVPPPEKKWPEVTRVGAWEHPEAMAISTHLSLLGDRCHQGKNRATIRLTITTSDYIPGHYGPHDPHPPYPSLSLTLTALTPVKGQMGAREIGCFKALSGTNITAGNMVPRYLPNHTVVFDISVPGGP